MTDFLDYDGKIIAAILTPILLSIGYFYRASQESIKNKRVVLYILLEIWHRVSVFYKKDFEDVFKNLHSEVKLEFPDAVFDEKELEVTAKKVSPMLIEQVRVTSLSDLSSFEEKYNEAISMIAEESPLLAYKLNSSGQMRRLFDFSDMYIKGVSEAFGNNSDPNASLLIEKAKQHIELEVLELLEKDIKKVSFKISPLTFLFVNRTMNKRKKLLLSGLGNQEYKKVIKSLFVPILREKEQLNN